MSRSWVSSIDVWEEFYRGDNMPEKWDAYDKSFNKIDNLILERGQKLPQEVYHLVGEIVVKHTDGTFLIMKRDYCKHLGGMWELTAGGSALYGETSLECAIRELKEETGIETTNLIELDKVVHKENQSLYVLFLYVTDCKKDVVALQKGETIAYKWVTREEILNMQENMASSRTLKLLLEQRF